MWYVGLFFMILGIVFYGMLYFRNIEDSYNSNVLSFYIRDSILGYLFTQIGIMIMVVYFIIS